MTLDNQFSAAALLDGGWTPEDRDDMIAEYGLTSEQADEIIKEMMQIREAQADTN